MSARHPTSDTRPEAPDPSDTDPEDRQFLLRRAAIAPLCLCLVAGLHAFRVVTCGQTQWKGGGFGMFSTVDSEATRFVRAFAQTPEGELPLDIPKYLEKTAAELKAAPTQAKIDALAGRLASIHWRRPDERLVREAQRWSDAESPFAPRKDAHALSESHLPQPTIGLYRSLEAIPPDQPPEHALGVSAIRVECWTMRLESGARNATDGVPYTTLRGEKLREATVETPVEATVETTAEAQP